MLNFQSDITEDIYLADYRYEQVDINTPMKKITKLYSTDIYLSRDHPLFNVGVLFNSLSNNYGSGYSFKLKDIGQDLDIMCNQLLKVKRSTKNKQK